MRMTGPGTSILVAFSLSVMVAMEAIAQQSQPGADTGTPSIETTTADPAASDDASATGSDEKSPFPPQDTSFRSPTNLPNQIRDDSEDKESFVSPLLTQDFINSWNAFKDKLYEDTGIRFSLAYAYVLQHATSSRSLTGSGGQFELNVTWDVIGRDGTGPKGFFGGKLENRHRVFSSTSPQFVAPLMGSIWTGATGYGEQDWSLPELWYEHHFVRDRVLIRVGKIIPFAVFDYYKYKSPRTGFLGQPQNASPTIPFPPTALGGGGGGRLTNGIYAGIGVFDANGVPTQSGFKSLSEFGELFTIADVGWAPDFVEGYEPGRDYIPGNDDVHLTVWHSDPRQSIGRPEGWGLIASVQKGFGKVVPFVRYGYSHGGATPLRHMFNVGVGFDDVLGYQDDTIGVGFTVGDPFAQGARNQYALELYYKMQITPHFALTPDIQLIANPANDPTTDWLGLFSIRARIAL